MIQKLIMNLLTDSTISTNDIDDSTDAPPCNPHTPSSYYVFDPMSQEQVTLETSMMPHLLSMAKKRMYYNIS